VSETSRQLRDLLEAAVGEPPRTVTIQAVRRRVTRRRIIESVTAAIVAVLVTGLGVALAARASGAGPASGPRPPAGVPRYYVEQGIRNTTPAVTVIRATATGAVTAAVHCPGRGDSILDGGIAASSHRTFFLVCEELTGPRNDPQVTGSRIYRFHLTATGRIARYTLMPGGSLDGLGVSGVTASADGAEVAVTTGPAGPVNSRVSAGIMVINTRTGTRALWHGSPAVPGKMALSAGDPSLTADGRELVYLATPRCIRGHCQPTGNGQEVRALSPAAAGGQLSSSRILARQSALVPLASGYLDGALVSANGSSVFVLEMNSPPRGGSTTVSVVKVSAATGRPSRVVYRVPTGNGFSFRFFSADPFRRYLLLDAGPPNGAMPNGWIYHRHLLPLSPRDGTNVFYETW
jgi:hypothetical protein